MSMKKFLPLLLLFVFSILNKSFAQVDLSNIDLRDIIGKVMHVEKGFAPQFKLGKTPVAKIEKVAEILGLKKK